MTSTQEEILEVINVYGPISDQALVPLAQHVGQVHQSSSGIRTRRSELARKGLVEAVDSIVLPSGRTAAVWGVKCS